VTNLQRLFHAIFHVLRGPKPQDVEAPLLSSVLTSKSDSGPCKGLHRQSNLPRSLHRLLTTAIFLTHFIISIAVLENLPPDAGLQKRATFSTLNVGLAGTGNQTWVTCVASSSTNRSAIHYASSRARGQTFLKLNSVEQDLNSLATSCDKNSLETSCDKAGGEGRLNRSVSA
jgi:hypothetical protein